MPVLLHLRLLLYFMPNPLNHSFGAGNLNISSELLHSVLNNSFDPSINNKSEIIHKNTSPYMPYFQKMREIELKGLVKLGLDLQRELHILANEGDLLIPKVKFLDILVKLSGIRFSSLKLKMFYAKLSKLTFYMSLSENSKATPRGKSSLVSTLIIYHWRVWLGFWNQ